MAGLCATAFLKSSMRGRDLVVDEKRGQEDSSLQAVRPGSRSCLPYCFPRGGSVLDPFDEVHGFGASHGTSEIVIGLVAGLLKIGESTRYEL